jgi:glyoxylase-like metal-dependent hydrolase (beta-lactamase superfamily II)
VSQPESYEVFAVKFGSWPERRRYNNFIMADPHDGPGQLDFYVWACVNERRTVVVDLGFDRKEAEARGRKIDRLPHEGLAMLGIDPAKVEHVVISHMHWDHVGTQDVFPNALFHIQDLEMEFVTGRLMNDYFFRRPFTLEHVQAMIRRIYAGRVQFHNGEGEVAPGISVHHIGGHTLGMQSVRVLTKRGWVVLASDASHTYENFEKIQPFTTVVNVADMVAGYRTLVRLAETPKHVIPGHDPLVLKRYPAPRAGLEGIIARLDVVPTE